MPRKGKRKTRQNEKKGKKVEGRKKESGNEERGKIKGGKVERKWNGGSKPGKKRL